MEGEMKDKNPAGKDAGNDTACIRYSMRKDTCSLFVGIASLSDRIFRHDFQEKILKM